MIDGVVEIMIQRPGSVAGILAGIFRFFEVLLYFWIFLIFLSVIFLWNFYFPIRAVWCSMPTQKFEVY